VEPEPVETLSCDTLTVFEDDARSYARTEPEFVPPFRAIEPAYPFTPPTKEAAAAARRFWLTVIRRFTEPVPEHRGRVRVKGSGDPEGGEFILQHGMGRTPRERSAVPPQATTGGELDVAHTLYLTVYRAIDGGVEFSPIPWTELVQIRFRRFDRSSLRDSG
jgi:hypothetical protein